jgi:hypothetical protein
VALYDQLPGQTLPLSVSFWQCLAALCEDRFAGAADVI